MKCHYILIFIILLKESFEQGKICEDNDSCCSSSDEISTRKPTTSTTPKQIILPKGRFYNFIVNICETLITRLNPNQLSHYLEILSKALKGLGSNRFMKRRIEKFRKILKKLSRLNGNQVKIKVGEFLGILREGNPDMYEFFIAMNNLFTMKHDIRMDDYIYDLKRFGKGFNKRTIVDKTRDVFEILVFYVLNKQRKNIKIDIEYKFVKAYIEYKQKH